MPSAAILVGGQATRFGGRDKSALVVGGRSILTHQVEELSQVADDILLVGSSGPPLETLETTTAGVRQVADRLPGQGPLAGLDAGLAAARHDVLVVVACDMPFVTARFLAFLVSLADGFDAVVPRTEDGYHPLCAVYTRRCRPAVTRHLSEGRLALVELLDDLRLRVVEGAAIDAFGDRRRLFTNLNTPATYHEVCGEDHRLQRHQT